MYKIGIIGSDNSHAEIFSKLVNLPQESDGKLLYPDMKITCIFGEDKERTEEVAKKGNIDTIVDSPEQMLGNVDAVMIVFRHGGLHAQYALQFLNKGIPVWIDKPFTISNEDAKAVFAAAEKNGCLLTGGSTCKYTEDIITIRKIVEGKSRIGNIKTAVMNFPSTLANDYGGIYFYGAHLVEMATAAFGYNPNSVVASENNGLVTAIVKYEKYQITLNFIPDSKEFYSLMYGENGTMLREIDIGDCYLKGFDMFVQMLRNKQLPISFERLYTPVELLNAIVEAYETGDEIFLMGSR